MFVYFCPRRLETGSENWRPGASSVAHPRRRVMLLPEEIDTAVCTPLNPPTVGSHGDVRKRVLTGAPRGTSPPPNDKPLSVVLLLSLPRPNAETPPGVTARPGTNDAIASRLPC